MTEAEWKILRTVKGAALERLCGRIMDECQVEIQGSGTNHERYLRLFQVVRQGDDDIARAVAYALEQPESVDVNEILVRPITQPT